MTWSPGNRGTGRVAPVLGRCRADWIPAYAGMTGVASERRAEAGFALAEFGAGVFEGLF